MNHDMSPMASLIIEQLKALANPENVKGMARFGINSTNTLGIPMPVIRDLAKKYKKQHELARELWESGIHEARILAALIDDPKKLTPDQMERWVSQFDSWDVCDQVCMNLFRKSPQAFEKAKEWAQRESEFQKRAGFAMMATLAVHARDADRKLFEEFLFIIRQESSDERNFVKKAVNWALRQIGKKNLCLHAEALKSSYEIEKLDSKAARWIAKDAIRELTSEAVMGRLIMRQLDN